MIYELKYITSDLYINITLPSVAVSPLGASDVNKCNNKEYISIATIL